MSQAKLPKELQFRKGDTVKMVQLKSKKNWNGKFATIVGPYSKSKKRWAVEVNYDKSQALIQPKNLRIHRYGTEWVIDTNSPIQRINLLLKAYTRDLEAFSKLTRREKKIFDDNFVYEMHDNIICSGLSGFDKELNLMKTTIIKLCEQNKNEQAERYLIDETQVMTLDDDLKKFQINVSIKVDPANNKLWRRIAHVHLDEKTKLIKFAKIISMDIVDDPKAVDTKKKQNNTKDENKMSDDLKGIVNAINQQIDEKQKEDKEKNKNNESNDAKNEQNNNDDNVEETSTK